ncbi:universal stress protein [Roseimaritima ulvae]|uniref:Universal stress protein n=1 Tax=Roseimaritima ulvae TaxID=980254 RepID=A0A5B9QRM5_9BACT|nr:universal stress protein [Roseimaritima ulvae]QEG40569.1 Universal stress protein [Roseimaritima ulvae]
MKILLATDGSGPAKEATRLVRSMAKNNSVDVHVLTVSYDPAQYATQPWVPEWVEQEKQVSHQILDQAQTILEDDCESVTLVHQAGPTVPCILEQAEAADVDLIVLAAKGRSALRRVLLGSVSDSVATSAKCSVLVVRANEGAELEPCKIVLGFDQSVASREAVAELMEWNFHRDCAVDLVSVAVQAFSFVGEGYEGPPLTLNPQRVEQIQQSADRMASQIAEHFPHTKVHSPVSSHVGDSIVSIAESTKANMVVVGDSGHSQIGQFLLGSTSKYVLRHAPCHVWISRHHWNADPIMGQREKAAVGK